MLQERSGGNIFCGVMRITATVTATTAYDFIENSLGGSVDRDYRFGDL